MKTRLSLLSLFIALSPAILLAQNVGVDVAIPQQKLDVLGGIRIGNTTTGLAGSIRWTGTQFEGHDGLVWSPFGSSSGTAWSLTGNSGTTPGTNFIGTTDGQAFRIKVNNQNAGYIDYATPFSAAFGYQALNVNTGINNAAFGYQALKLNTSGVNNTAVGAFTLGANTTGSYNTAMGAALAANTTGQNNTAMGDGSLLSNTTGSNNTGLGGNALNSNTTGGSNSAVGVGALNDNTTGGSNTAVGTNALVHNTTGNFNIAVGSGTLNNNATANNNTAIGYLASNKNNAGSNNSSLGYLALYNTTTGGSNAAVGSNALVTNVTGSNNTAVGSGADVSSSALTNATAIGYNAKVAASNALVLGGTGADAVNVGIGTTAPAQALHVYRSGADAIIKVESPGSANEARVEFWKFGTFNAGVGFYPGTSDIRLRTGQSSGVIFEPNSIEKMRLTAAGNLGIGTAAPADLLHVVGNIRMVDGNQAAGKVLVSDANGKATWTAPNAFLHTLQDTDQDTKVQVEESADEDKIRFDTFGAERMIIDNNGNVGIASTNPSQKLDVQGKIAVIDGTQNTFVGSGAGVSSTSSYLNVALGYEALKNLTTSGDNTALGYRNSTALTTGGSNSSIGSYALSSLTTGGSNVALGYGALNSMVDGNNNVAIGRAAGTGNTNGSGNVFIGFRAGDGSSGSNELYIDNSNVTTPLIYGNFSSNIININGNLGVNTATPGQRLDVNGDARIQNGTVHVWAVNATEGGQINLADGNNDADGQTNAWSLDVSNNDFRIMDDGAVRAFFQDDGNLGIGTTVPAQKLDVNGKIQMRTGAAVGSVPVSDASGTMTWTALNSLPVNQIHDADNDTKVQVEESADEDKIRFDTFGAERMIIDNAGNVGIGLTSPLSSLDVAGTNAGTTSLQLRSGNSSNTSISNQVVFSYNGNNNYKSAIKTRHHASQDAGNAIDFFVWDFGTDAATDVGTKRVLTIDGGGNGMVGIGTSIPAEELHVVGNIRMVDGTQAANRILRSDANGTATWVDPSTVGTWVDEIRDADNDTKIQAEESADEDKLRFDMAGTERFVMDGPHLYVKNSGSSVFMGDAAGANDDLSNNNNVFIGQSAGTLNTTGANNTALGSGALKANTTTSFNTAIGWDAMAGSITADNSTAVGHWSLHSNTDGTSNVAVGSHALRDNVNGDNNTAIGLSAGQGNLGSGNIFIGRSAGQSETGDNKLYIDNSSTTTPLIYGDLNTNIININGNLGINTATPGQRLDVNGDARIQNGTVNVWALNSTEGGQINLADGNNDADGQTNAWSLDVSNNDFRIMDDGAVRAFFQDDGNLGIATTTPAEKLDVNGKIRMRTGATTGYVPVSDANGTMTWTNPASLTTADDGDWTISGTNQYSAVSGNVGIGTSAPLQKLHVNTGDALFTGASATASGIEIIPRNATSNGGGRMYFREDNNELFGISMGYNGGNSGSEILNWPANTFNITTHSNNATGTIALTILRAGGNVGINTTNPAQKLDVAGKIQMQTGAAVGYVPVSDANGTMTWTNPASLTVTETDPQVSAATTNYVPKWNGTTLVDGSVYDNGTNVGIGTSSPNTPLTVGAALTNGLTPEMSVNTTGNRPLFVAETAGTTGVMIGYVGNDIQGRTGANFATNGDLLLNRFGGNVGVGTTVPAEKLDVNGKTKTTDFQMTNGAGAGRLLQSDASGNASWVNTTTLTINKIVDADNDTKVQVEKNTDEDIIRFDVAGSEIFAMKKAGANSQYLEVGSSNTIMGGGVSAGISGAYNTAYGFQAAMSLTSGQKNAYFGDNAGGMNTNGSNNTMVGTVAGQFNNGGGANTFVGGYAARNNAAGSNNTILGFSAGENSTGSNNIFIGYNSGQNETGNNKLYIDNSSTTAPLIYGDFSTDVLQVNGTLNINNAYNMPTVAGTNGYVLQTNGAGAASWVDPTTLSVTETDPQVSSTTTNYIPKWNGTTLVDGLAYDNGTNIGVGTTAPTEIFHIVKNGFDNYLRIDAGGPSSNYSGVKLFEPGFDYGWYMRMDANTDDMYFAHSNGGNVSDRVTFQDGGNVGIGTTSPTSPLYVAAISASGPTLTVATGSNQYPSSVSILPSTHVTSRRATIELDNWGILQDITGSGVKDFAIYNNSTSSHSLSIKTDGNVGIGTTAAAQVLDVNGKIQMRTGATTGYVPVSDANGTMTWTDPATVVGAQGWKLTGNTGTVPATNFLGTADNVDFRIRTNNQERVTVTSGGNIGIGTTTVSTIFGGNIGVEIKGDVPQILFNDNTGGSTDDMRIYNGGAFAAIQNATAGVDIMSFGLAANTNNVGIGTTAPAQTLDVNGKIQMRTGATTGYVPVSDANGTMTWTNPTSLTITETDPQVSSATTNKIPKWNGTTLVDGVAYDDGTNIGIGTTAPSEKLEVQNGNLLISTSNLFTSSKISIYGARNGGGAPWNTASGGGPAVLNFDNYDPNSAAVRYTGAVIESGNNPGNNDGNLRFLTANNMVLAEAMRIDNTGNIGMGAEPTQKLHVVGNIRMVDGNQAAGKVMVSDANGTATWTAATSLTVTEADPQVSSTTANYVPKWDGTTLIDASIYDNGTSIGIGTTAPISKLHVVGTSNLMTDIESSSATGTWLRLRNNNSSSVWNFITTGNSNSEGPGKLLVRDNTAVQVVVQSNGNVGLGTTAPASTLDITGSNAGTSSLLLRSGNSGAGTVSNQITFGYNGAADYRSAVKTRHNSGGDAGNAIDFYVWDQGTDAQGAVGTKRVLTIDGNGTNGSVGIGTSAPATPLHVVGNIRMVDGNQAANKVMVSDANGTATWTDATSLTITETDPQVSSTTANYVPKWNGTTLTDGSIYDNGNVGIGSSAPISTLEVQGAANAIAAVTIDQQGTDQYTGTNIQRDGTEKWFTGMNASNNNYIIRGNATTDFVTIDNSTGNVGIGSTAPNFDLDIRKNEAMVSQQIYSEDATNGVGQLLVGASSGGHVNLIANTSTATYIGIPAGYSGVSTNFTDMIFATGTGGTAAERMRLTTSGNLGIGTTTPNVLLHVVAPGASDQVVARFTQSNTTNGNTTLVGLSTEGSTWSKGAIGFQRTGSYDVGDITFNLNTNSGGGTDVSEADERMRITSDGRVGIGTNNPTQAKLVVNGYATYTNLNARYYNAAGTNASTTTNRNLSAYFSDHIACGELQVFSDERIKNIKGISDSREDLNKLMGIQITDYMLKDTIGKGNNTYKKVIAQQVEKVYPQAVSTVTDVVPDIYKMASISEGKIVVANNLKAGEKVKLIFEDRTELAEVLEADAEGFKVNMPDNGQVFVFGREVSDFHTVDYEALSMLNISATQELVKMISQLKNENNEMKNKFSSLSSDVEMLKALLNTSTKAEK